MTRGCVKGTRRSVGMEEGRRLGLLFLRAKGLLKELKERGCTTHCGSSEVPRDS